MLFTAQSEREGFMLLSLRIKKMPTFLHCGSLVFVYELTYLGPDWLGTGRIFICATGPMARTSCLVWFGLFLRRYFFCSSARYPGLILCTSCPVLKAKFIQRAPTQLCLLENGARGQDLDSGLLRGSLSGGIANLRCQMDRARIP